MILRDNWTFFHAKNHKWPKLKYILHRKITAILPQVLLRKPCYAFSFFLVGLFSTPFKYLQIINIWYSPVISPAHPIRWSDGRCVQRAGTYSARVDNTRLQDTPRWRSKISRIYPRHDVDLLLSLLYLSRQTSWIHHCSARAAQNV